MKALTKILIGRNIRELIESSRSSNTLGNTGKVSYHYSIDKGGGYLQGARHSLHARAHTCPHVHTRIEHVLDIIKSKQKRKNNCLSCCFCTTLDHWYYGIIVNMLPGPLCSLPSREATSITQDSRSRRSASEFTALLVAARQAGPCAHRLFSGGQEAG